MNELHFGVVVGINCYPGIPNQLTTARNDAEAFAAWLTAPDEGGLPDDDGHVRVITADPAEEDTFTAFYKARPVRQEVLTALAEFHEKVEKLSDADWSRTRLYVYVAGHGVATPAGRGALLFADAKPRTEQPKSHWGYWSDPLDLGQYEMLYEQVTPFREVVLLADCCREIAEGVPVSSAPPFDGPRRGETRRLLGFASEHSRRAAAPTLAPGSVDTDARGFFTKALLEGFRGQAPHDPETGAITGDHLERYIEARVPELAATYDYDQRASFLGARAGSIEFARVPVRRFRVELRFPPTWEGAVTVTNGDWAASLPPPAAPGRIVIELPNGVYKAALGPGGPSRVFEVPEDGEVVDVTAP